MARHNVGSAEKRRPPRPNPSFDPGAVGQVFEWAGDGSWHLLVKPEKSLRKGVRWTALNLDNDRANVILMDRYMRSNGWSKVL